jgi:hypothetical protein
LDVSVEDKRKTGSKEDLYVNVPDIGQNDHVMG